MVLNIHIKWISPYLEIVEPCVFVSDCERAFSLFFSTTSVTAFWECLSQYAIIFSWTLFESSDCRLHWFCLIRHHKHWEYQQLRRQSHGDQDYLTGTNEQTIMLLFFTKPLMPVFNLFLVKCMQLYSGYVIYCHCKSAYQSQSATHIHFHQKDQW
jgi:hypothetical protein